MQESRLGTTNNSQDRRHDGNNEDVEMRDVWNDELIGGEVGCRLEEGEVAAMDVSGDENQRTFENAQDEQVGNEHEGGVCNEEESEHESGADADDEGEGGSSGEDSSFVEEDSSHQANAAGSNDEREGTASSEGLVCNPTLDDEKNDGYITSDEDGKHAHNADSDDEREGTVSSEGLGPVLNTTRDDEKYEDFDIIMHDDDETLDGAFELEEGDIEMHDVQEADVEMSDNERREMD